MKIATTIINRYQLGQFRVKYGFAERVTSELFNPYTRQFLSSKPYLTDDQLFTKMSESNSAHRKWKNTPLQTRIHLVKQLLDNVMADKNVLKHQIASQIGKSYNNIDEEFRRIQSIAEDLIDSGRKALQPQVSQVQKNRLIKTIFEPVGVSMLFPYFSQPIFDSIIHLIPCLISGNAALIKPSDYNHFLGPYLEQKSKGIFDLPGLITEVFIQPQQLPLISQFRSLKKVLYAGSSQMAKHIFEVLIQNRFIDCNLFFGGKDAAYVDPTADLSFAAQQIVKYSFYNNGQSYDSIHRVYIEESIEEQFLALLRAQIQKITIGNPISPSTQLGPLCVIQNSTIAQQYVNESISEGAKCQIGGLITDDGNEAGVFFEPTLLSGCTNDMTLVQNQIHAPILCALTTTFESLANEINESQYGTGVRIFTGQINKYEDIVKRLQVGKISFNSGSLFVGNLPIEGWKRSGKGKLLSELSYEQFSIPKSYNINQL